MLKERITEELAKMGYTATKGVIDQLAKRAYNEIERRKYLGVDPRICVSTTIERVVDRTIPRNEGYQFMHLEDC